MNLPKIMNFSAKKVSNLRFKTTIAELGIRNQAYFVDHDVGIAEASFSKIG